MKLYALKMKNGYVVPLEVHGVTPQEAYGKWPNADEVESFIEISRDSLPASRYFRDAWVMDGAQIKEDLVKAKDIQLEKISKAEQKKIEELNELYILADEQGNDAEKSRITLQRQAVKNVAEELKNLNPTSIDDIKNAWKDILD